MAQKPINILDDSEIPYIRDWLVGQSKKGLFGLGYDGVINNSHNKKDLLRILDEYLPKEGRTRLQSALSAKRTRLESKKTKTDPAKKIVQTNITTQARNILNTVATSRGITTSELILAAFGDEYESVGGDD